MFNRKPPSVQTLSYFMIVAVILLLACLGNLICAIDLAVDGHVEEAWTFLWVAFGTGPIGVVFVFITVYGLSKRM